MIQLIAFYLFATIVIASAAMVIFARNPVHSVMWLILAFFNAAGLMLLAGAEFIAMLLVIVYVGAVAVLFLFVVMMLDVDADAVRQGFWKHFPLAGFIGALIALEMALVLMGGFRLAEAAPADPKLAQLGNSKLLGVDERLFEGFQMVVVELKLQLEGSIGHPAPTLQHSNCLVEDLFKGHGYLIEVAMEPGDWIDQQCSASA